MVSRHLSIFNASKTNIRTTTNREMCHPSVLSSKILFCSIFVFVLLTLPVEGSGFEHNAVDGEYTNSFACEINGGRGEAKQIAANLGYTFLEEVIPGSNIYHFEHNSIVKRSVDPSLEHHKSLAEERKISWFEQQKGKRRVKRSIVETSAFNDPRWAQMWYLNGGHGRDMNVAGAWAEGITGKDIVITILDDGIEHDHPDLVDNYDTDASFDVNDNDSDPQPRYDLADTNRHGTRCAGEIAAKPNNSMCTVGVAYESRVGGVRMLDGEVTDLVEAKSLSVSPQHVDIYSASWGPDDDGRTVDGPGKLATKAFIEGILRGRRGLGSIFVWASGNGGRDQDNCNCDGYTNSIWTLSISSATENGLVPWYSEACSSSLATTYSSGSAGERQVITTDLHHGCTSRHTGTSASAPLAAGICALALQANRNLTWRDMQHIVVRTAKPENLFAKDWAVNGVNRKVSHSFGYGLMDASAMVRLAKTWKTAPKAKECEVRAHHMDKVIPAKSHVELTLEVQSCEHVNFLEHVQAKVTLSTTSRGDISIYLVSPQGTRSTLLALRPHDTSRKGFSAWPFMTVHNWGENPHGKWKLEIHNEGRYFSRAKLREWSLVLYGTTEDPDNKIERTSTRPPSSTHPYPDTTSSPKNDKTIESNEIKSPDLTKIETSTKMKTLSTTEMPGLSSSKLTTISVTDNSLKANGEYKNNDPASVVDWSHLQYGQSKSGVGNVSRSSCSLLSNDARRCLECEKPYNLFYGLCVWKCPINHFSAINYGRRGAVSGMVCRTCHYTCKSCSGSIDDQCIECFGDARLKDGHCYPVKVFDDIKNMSDWRIISLVTFILLFLALFSLVIYVVCSKYSPNMPQIVSHHQYSQLNPKTNGHNSAVVRCYSDDDSNDDV